jgi:hypothetical protein
MKLQEAVNAFISKCWMNGNPCTVQPKFKETYVIDGKDYKFTQEVYEEICKDDRVKITNVNDKSVNIMGIEGMSD